MARSRELTRTLLRAGVVAGPLFVAAFTVEGATRPDYSPARHPVSGLALGPGGSRQVANFIVTGGLYLASAVGLARTPAVAGRRVVPVLVGAVGAGLVGAGMFPTDPISGYPVGTPAMPTDHSRLGILHDAFSAPVFLCLPVAAFTQAVSAARARDPRWAAWSAASGSAMFAAFVLAGGGFSQQPGLTERAGWLQRLSLVAGFGWLSALATRALRRTG
jgi:hypothetical protein